jgi:hypothetical protein
MVGVDEIGIFLLLVRLLLLVLRVGLFLLQRLALSARQFGLALLLFR